MMTSKINEPSLTDYTALKAQVRETLVLGQRRIEQMRIVAEVERRLSVVEQAFTGKLL